VSGETKKVTVPSSGATAAPARALAIVAAHMSMRWATPAVMLNKRPNLASKKIYNWSSLVKYDVLL
jgi:hypothetical protein